MQYGFSGRKTVGLDKGRERLKAMSTKQLVGKYFNNSGPNKIVLVHIPRTRTDPDTVDSQ